MRRVPSSLHWLLWDLDCSKLDVDRHADSILARVLENGGLEEVRTVMRIYGPDRIHRFFLAVAHPIISERTRTFWRAYFRAKREPWPEPPAFLKSSAAPWID
jgi:hypothetical protein